MGQKDIAEKTLESYNDVFADIANVIMFDGRQVIQEDELEDVSEYSMYKSDDKLHEQQRDCAKFWKKKEIRIALCGFENQTKPDKYMPMRVIGYDGAAYRAELSDDTLTKYYPVITLVLYFGETHWNTSKQLTDCFEIEDDLKPFVSDYKINVVEVSFLTEEQVSKFKSDFKIIADFFVQTRQGGYKPSEDKIRHVDEVFKLMSVLTGDQRFDETYNSRKQNYNNEQGGKEMCKVIDDFINEGREKGMQQGAHDNAVETAQRMLNKGCEPDFIAEMTGLSLADVNNICLK